MKDKSYGKMAPVISELTSKRKDQNKQKQLLHKKTVLFKDFLKFV